MNLRTIILPLVAIAMLGPTHSHAALNAYLTLTGETQGEIKGSVTQAGREDSMEIIAFSHSVVSPRDAASGLPTGKRQHKPLTIVKEIDKATPLLMLVLSNNENITEWELRFYRPTSAGTEEHYYTIQLENASIAGIRSWKPNTKDPASRNYGDMVEISFAYQKIIWTYEDGGITAEDDWETPRAIAPVGEKK